MRDRTQEQAAMERLLIFFNGRSAKPHKTSQHVCLSAASSLNAQCIRLRCYANRVHWTIYFCTAQNYSNPSVVERSGVMRYEYNNIGKPIRRPRFVRFSLPARTIHIHLVVDVAGGFAWWSAVIIGGTWNSVYNSKVSDFITTDCAVYVHSYGS